MNQLLESYKKRMTIAERYYAQRHDGAKLSQDKKMVTAVCLNNINKYLTESYRNSVGVQATDVSMLRQFAMDVTNLVMPNLIAHELVLVKPMEGRNTVLYYREYALGTPKGGVGGDVEEDPFTAAMKGYSSDWNSNEFDESATIVNGWGTSDFFKMNEGRQNYTGERVVEDIKEGAVPAKFSCMWGPVKAAAFAEEAKRTTNCAVKVVHYTKTAAGKLEEGTTEYFGIKDNLKGGREVDGYTPAAFDKIAYIYDNAYIPAEQLPTVVMKMKSKPVTAGIKRIAIKYSKLAAYEAKKEYGFDLQSELVKQATTELEYSTDTDILKLLIAMGDRNVDAGPKYGKFVFIDEELPTLSVALKAEGFLRVLKKAQAALYKQTARFQANWMLCGPDAMTVISFLPNFKGSDAGIGNGAYCAGSLDGMKVFVTPAITDGSCYLGVLGKEMDCAPAAYLPYMPITPSSLIDLPDDTTTQGLTICSMY